MAVQWLKKGKEAHQEVQRADQETAKKQAAASVRRFWLKTGNETQITFLDGDLDDDGLVKSVTVWEHNLKLNGRYGNYYTCTQDVEPCPICNDEKGDTPSLVAAFTVLDHTQWTDKNGKTHQHEKRLFACKRETFKRLQNLASKRGGLRGATFDVSRIGDRSAAVGSDFDFVEKRELPEIAKAYGFESVDDLAPFNYEEVFVFRTADELRELGFGGSVVGSADVVGYGGAPSKVDYSKEL